MLFHELSYWQLLPMLVKGKQTCHTKVSNVCPNEIVCTVIWLYPHIPSLALHLRPTLTPNIQWFAPAKEIFPRYMILVKITCFTTYPIWGWCVLRATHLKVVWFYNPYLSKGWCVSITPHLRVVCFYDPPSEGAVFISPSIWGWCFYDPPHPKVVYLNDPPSEGGVFIWPPPIWGWCVFYAPHRSIWTPMAHLNL